MLGTLPSHCLRTPFRTVSRNRPKSPARLRTEAPKVDETGPRSPISLPGTNKMKAPESPLTPFRMVSLETVRKGILRQRLGRVPSMRRAYQTDLSDAEWAYIEPHIPTPKAPGRPRVHPLREILNAIFYIVKSGCAWRLLPHD